MIPAYTGSIPVSATSLQQLADTALRRARTLQVFGPVLLLVFIPAARDQLCPTSPSFLNKVRRLRIVRRYAEPSDDGGGDRAVPQGCETAPVGFGTRKTGRVRGGVRKRRWALAGRGTRGGAGDLLLSQRTVA